MQKSRTGTEKEAQGRIAEIEKVVQNGSLQAKIELYAV